MYIACLECESQFDTREQLIEEHVEQLSTISEHEADVTARATAVATQFCPRCLHDFPYGPEAFQ